MILNKDGQVVANVSQPVIAFDTEEEYVNWKTNILPAPEVEKYFIVIKKYMSGPGIMEVESEDSFNTVPKYPNTLYIDLSTNSLWRYDSVNETFIKLTNGG